MTSELAYQFILFELKYVNNKVSDERLKRADALCLIFYFDIMLPLVRGFFMSKIRGKVLTAERKMIVTECEIA